jgi:hypothetical protein
LSDRSKSAEEHAMESPNTPDAGGYLLAWAVSIGVVVLAFALGSVVLGGDTPAQALGALFLWAFVTTVVSAPLAAVGIPLVHLACRNVRAQSVHVLAAGVAGALPVVVCSVIAGRPLGFADGLALVPVATAIGRWSVVPLVRRRRERPAGPPVLDASVAR